LTLVVKQENDESVDALERIRDLAIISDTPPQESSEFFNEIHSRLPAPLVLLSNLLPTASSPKLRQAATELCHAILVETHSVWDQDETSNVPRAAIECCIALSLDKDGTYQL
jgi:3-keto-L-gulonate-6-phosphate decarboxylase